MARSRRKIRRPSKKSIQKTAESLLGVAAYIGPEVATAWAGGFSPESIAQAISLKTGFNFMDGSFDLSRLAMGWGPTLAFTGAKKGKALVNKIISRM